MLLIHLRHVRNPVLPFLRFGGVRNQQEMLSQISQTFPAQEKNAGRTMSRGKVFGQMSWKRAAVVGHEDEISFLAPLKQVFIR